MKKHHRTFALIALASTALCSKASAGLIPNGDFEAGAAGWDQFDAGGSYAYEFPSTGGNPDGYGVIDNTGGGGGFGIFISNSGSVFTLDSLGLTAGESYVFTQDMIILSGENHGGFKVDYFTGETGIGSSGEEFADPIDGGSWKTYSFDVDIPAAADGVKIVPLWGADSKIGYDNIRFLDPVPEIFEADIEVGTVLSWEPEGSGLVHQPQFSFDDEEWNNIGDAVVGESPTSIFVTDEAPFYRVNVEQIVIDTALINGDFEVDGGDGCAEGWICFTSSSQPPTRITTDSRSGEASIRIAVINDNAGAPNTAELQQNVRIAGGTIIPGESYDFFFWAKQIDFGVSYVQNYRVQWRNGDDVPIGDPPFTQFMGGDNEWAEIRTNGLVAPDGAETAFIQIFGATGAVPGATALGEVLIDDIILGGSAVEEFDTITAELAPGVRITWDTKSGTSYQVQSSATDLDGFVDFGMPVPGDNETAAISDLLDPDAKFFRVLKVGE
ncbi:MAG: hypothetical protein ACI8XO_000493 [Verrucomicrobiales bacterium]|jgi:hypothetical protein